LQSISGILGTAIAGLIFGLSSHANVHLRLEIRRTKRLNQLQQVAEFRELRAANAKKN